MYELIILWPVLSPLLAIAYAIAVWFRIGSIDDGVNETNRLLQSLLYLEQKRHDSAVAPGERSETGEGSSDSQGRKASQIESYGDLSNVGRLKNPKP